MCVKTSTFANICAQIKQMSNFQPLDVLGRGSSKLVKIKKNRGIGIRVDI